MFKYSLIIKKILFVCVSFSFLCLSQYANSSTKTASSLGKGNWEAGFHLDDLLFTTGSFDPINFSVYPNVSVTGGLSENFDLTLSRGRLDVKYALLNNTEGFSVAVIGTWVFGFSRLPAVTTTLNTGVGIGPILSYKLNWFEPYLSGGYSYNYVSLFSKNEKDSEHAHNQSIGGSLGFNSWFSESVALNLNVGAGFEIDKDIVRYRLGLGLLWRI